MLGQPLDSTVYLNDVVFLFFPCIKINASSMYKFLLQQLEADIAHPTEVAIDSKDILHIARARLLLYANVYTSENKNVA